jgi:phosphate transport system protein
MERLKKDILALSTVVEEAFRLAMEAFEHKDPTLACRIIEGDARIDQLEVDLEEECLKLLALYQPVAIDLRFIVSVLKINSDLERIGDLAVNIAERVEFLSTRQLVEPPAVLLEMAGIARSMLHGALDALVNMETPPAYEVCRMDQRVDDLHRRMYPIIEAKIHQDPQHLEALLRILTVSRFIERVADHSTNIAEDVVYMLEGEIVRHRVEEHSDAAKKK